MHRDIRVVPHPWHRFLRDSTVVVRRRRPHAVTMGDMPLRRAIALVVLVAVAPLALVTYSVVRDGEGFAMPAGTSGRALVLAAGLGLAVAGLLHLWRRPELACGALLLGLAGAGWLVAEWDNPASTSDVVFTTGLVLWTVGPVLLTHAALAYPTGGLRSWTARVVCRGRLRHGGGPPRAHHRGGLRPSA